MSRRTRWTAVAAGVLGLVLAASAAGLALHITSRSRLTSFRHGVVTPAPSAPASPSLAASPSGAISPSPVQPSPTPEYLVTVRFVSPYSGWVLTDRRLLWTSNSGSTWQNTGLRSAGNSFEGMAATDDLHVWVITTTNDDLLGSPGRIARSSDGGRSWSWSELPSRGSCLQLHFLNTRDGYLLLGLGFASGSEGVALLWTHDGGASWRVVSTNDNVNPKAIPFGCHKNGIAFANLWIGWLGLSCPQDAPEFWTTADGGSSWIRATVGMPGAFRSEQCGNPGVFGPFVSSQGVVALAVSCLDPGPPPSGTLLIYRSSDSGRTWTYLGSGAGPCYEIAFLDSERGWAIGPQGMLLRTVDGGRSWTLPSSPVDVAGIDPINAETLWADIQNQPGVSLDGGRTWREVPLPAA